MSALLDRCFSALRLFLLKSCAIILSLFASQPSAYSQSFQVGTFTVCYGGARDSCAAATPPYDNLNRGLFVNNQIYVALTVICGADALQFLNSNGFLPINIAVWKDGRRNPADIPIPIAQADWDDNGDQLTSLSASQGFFPWRTRFKVKIAGAKIVEFEITDARKNSVTFNGAPARFTLTFANAGQ